MHHGGVAGVGLGGGGLCCGIHARDCIGPGRGGGAGAGGFYDGAWRVGLAWGASGQKGQQDDAMDQDEDAEDAHG